MKNDYKKTCLYLLGFFLLVCLIVTFKPTFEGMTSDNDGEEEHAHEDSKYSPSIMTPPESSSVISPVQITPGVDDLYMLKSEMVPPTSPVVYLNKEENKCPPCPPCGRCPEPSFECKKVPNYNSAPNNLPRPVLNDFSRF